jgi:predicted unusual protein kinase regulating ubiquinone biosynthesis (AarF/ABC1/UbiB family)
MDKMIYAIVSLTNHQEEPNELLAPLKGITGMTFEAVFFKDIIAVVSSIDRSGLKADRTSAMAYAGVIEALNQKFTLLPVRFGSIMESADAIIRMLERNYQAIQQNLVKVEGKCEYGLKIFSNTDRLRSELKAKSPCDEEKIAAVPLEKKNSVYRDWVNKKLQEHRLEELLLSYVDMVVASITKHLTGLDAISKIKKMVTASTLIDAVFLVDKKRTDVLVHATGELQKQYPGMNFMLTGPWPPYNFVEITIT